MKLDTVYISVKNMQGALEFYRRVFQKEPEEVSERFSSFRLGSITFGLYNPKIDGGKIRWGTNCVPCFQVENIEKEFDRLRQLAPLIDDKIHRYGNYYLFQFKDPEGNLIEVYEIKRK